MTPPRWLERGWRRQSSWLGLLAPLALLYASLATINACLHSRRSVTVKKNIIVIGNITLGGSGKTTLAGWLAEELHKQGKNVAIISKGYGRASHLPEPTRATADADCFGDEAAMLSQQLPQLPIWVCDDRLKAITSATADYLICDDGLQDYRFAPRTEIALIDGAYGFANGHLFPRGVLREPVARLQGCDLVIQQGGTSLVAPAEGIFRLAIRGFTNLVDGSYQTLAQAKKGWKNQRLHLCCGLANNQRVFAQFDSLGLVTRKHSFPDHHPFIAKDIDFPGKVLLTAKDAIKCSTFAHQDCWRIETRVEMPPELADRILRVADSTPLT